MPFHFKNTAAIIALIIATTFAPLTRAADKAPKVKLTQLEDRVRVEINGQLFTEYIFGVYAKPIMYPIIGPGGVEMMRHYPMKDDVPGESKDHIHQRSLWYTHGDVNGVDFWAEAGSKNPPLTNVGTIVQTGISKIESGNRGILHTNNKWVGPQNQILLTDSRAISFAMPGEDNEDRYIDFRITLKASHGDVTFGDTKEGSMGIRTHPNLRLKNDPKKGVTTANGQAINSNGDEGASLWGQKTPWVDYWGNIDGQTVGVAIFDHPSNYNYPTWWHARDYGLIAANPFGKHYFEGAEKGAGDFTLKNGESTTFRYRFLFHEGNAETASIAVRYAKFVTPKSP